MGVTAASPHHLTHESKPYYFCSARCQSKFADDPSAYNAKTAAADAPSDPDAPSAPSKAAPEGTIYTCPMHPEIRQDHMGNCPKCGVTLAMFGHRLGWFDMATQSWVELVLSLPVVL